MFAQAHPPKAVNRSKWSPGAETHTMPPSFRRFGYSFAGGIAWGIDLGSWQARTDRRRGWRSRSRWSRSRDSPSRRTPRPTRPLPRPLSRRPRRSPRRNPTRRSSICARRCARWSRDASRKGFRIESLFSVSLDRLEPVRNRLRLLQDEVTQLEETIALLTRRAADPEFRGSAPDRTRDPEDPAGRARSADPARAAGRAARRSGRRGAGRRASDGGGCHRGRRCRSSRPRAAGGVAAGHLRARDGGVRDREERLRGGAGGVRAGEGGYDRAFDEHRARIAEFVRKTEADLVNGRVRLEIARDRIAYLTALEKTLASMSDQARMTLGDGRGPRAPLHERAAAIVRRPGGPGAAGGAPGVFGGPHGGRLAGGLSREAPDVIDAIRSSARISPGRSPRWGTWRRRLDLLATDFEESGEHARWVFFSQVLARIGRAFSTGCSSSIWTSSAGLDGWRPTAGRCGPTRPSWPARWDVLIDRPEKIGTVTDAEHALTTSRRSASGSTRW